MPGEDIGDNATSGGHADRKERQSDLPLAPNLTLELPASHKDAPAFRPLTLDDQLYAIAAWAMCHGDGLDEEARAALYLALCAVWPQAKGQRRATTWRYLWALSLANQGVSAEQIASAWTVAPETARAWVRRGRKAVEDIRAAGPPRIESDSGAPPDLYAVAVRALMPTQPLLARRWDDYGRALNAARAAGVRWNPYGVDPPGRPRE